MSSEYKPWSTIRTKVVGVTMGDEAETRQLAIQTIKEHWEDRPRWFLDLVPDPDNPFDPSAIRVMCDVPDIGRVQIGFIQNAETRCGFCNRTFPKWPKVKGSNTTQCPVCGSEQLHRDGLATKVSQAMIDQPNESFYGEVLSITGGEEGKESYGLNFEIKRVYKKKVQT